MTEHTGIRVNTARLRSYMNILALEGLPQRADPVRAIREAGYQGIQFIQPLARDLAQQAAGSASAFAEAVA